MRRIAAAIGVTPMAIYHYFENREELLRSVADKEFEHFADWIRRMPTRHTVEDEIVHIMDAYIEYALAHPRIFDYLFSKPRTDARRFPNDFKERRSPTLTPMADTLQAWMDKGALKRDDVWEVAFELWAHAHGYLMLYRAGRFALSPDEFKQLVHRSIGRLLHGLKA